MDGLAERERERERERTSMDMARVGRGGERRDGTKVGEGMLKRVGREREREREAAGRMRQWHRLNSVNSKRKLF